MTDLISQQVDLLLVQAAAAMAQVRAGTVKAIANLSPQRSASMPDIPTADETGVPGLYMSGWFGFFAPKGTPKDVIAKLNGAMIARLQGKNTMTVTISVKVEDQMIPVIGMSLNRETEELAVGSIK
jgi:tripartite-type tricarboxylate transporter receptor subunit TctC